MREDPLTVLRRYNHWRRGIEYNGKFEEIPDPRVIGDALDALCDEVEALRRGFTDQPLAGPSETLEVARG